MKLIINADDFGLTKGVTLGILDAMTKGIVTDTTAMVNGVFLEEGMKEAKNRGIDSIGIHLTLTCGKPVLPPKEVSSLVDDNGDFYRRIGNLEDFNYEEIRKELKAQMEKFYTYGITPSHIDGHHHFFGYNKELTEIVIELAKEYKLPLRVLSDNMVQYYKSKGVKTTEAFSMEFYQDNVNEAFLKELLLRYKDADSLEIMCHPAYIDEELMRISSYNNFREKEFDILTSDKIKIYIKENNIKLISFKEI